MTSIVFLTVVGYFLFLPKTAPKLITVAILPLDAPDDFPEHLSRALPRHITEILAESRDMFVVDYDAAEEAVALKSKSRGFRNELGTTHIVDGSFEVNDESPNTWVLHMRLVDVAKDVWKLKWSDDFLYPELSLLDIRNAIVTAVAEGLYDNSIPDRKSPALNSEGLAQYLQASAMVHAGNTDGAVGLLLNQPKELQSAYSMFLLAKLFPSSRKMYVENALAFQSSYYPALILRSKSRYEESRNLISYLRETIVFAGQYPNSDAVQELASLYTDFGWFEEAKDVLLRWAQIRPRSSAPALAIAFNRFRMNDSQGVADALEIARLRDPSNELVDRYRALYEWKVNGKTLLPDTSEYLQWIARYENDEFSEFDPQWSTFVTELSCYDQVQLSLYLNSHDYIFEEYDCFDSRLWIQPPPWWADDDPNWLAFREDPRFDGWLETKGIRFDVLEKVEPVSAKELFAPQRKVLKSNGSEMDENFPSS